MPNYLPFSGTKISARESMMRTQISLEEVGFEGTAIVSLRGSHEIRAVYESVEFSFKIDLANIVKALVDNSSKTRQRDIRMKNERGNAALQEIEEQAGRVGWRLLAEHVKAVTDSVKLGVIDRAQAFAGNLLLVRKNGESITLADHIKIAMAEGTLSAPGFFEPLKLEASNE